MIRILALDGHQAILEALSSSIGKESDMELCGVTTSVDEALRLVDSEHPDVVVIEVNLLSKYGLDVAAELHERHPDLKIVFFSLCPEIIYAERALRVGASGFLMKSEPTSSVVEAIRRVMDGEIVLSETITEHLMQTQDHDMDGEISGDLHATSVLTDRELAVFHFLGRGKDVDEIAETLEIAPKTVETYRLRIREKLELEDRARLLRFAFECAEAATMAR